MNYLEECMHSAVDAVPYWIKAPFAILTILGCEWILHPGNPENMPLWMPYALRWFQVASVIVLLYWTGQAVYRMLQKIESER